MNPIERISLKESPSNRIVLISADGLRADSFFNLLKEDENLFLKFVDKNYDLRRNLNEIIICCFKVKSRIQITQQWVYRTLKFRPNLDLYLKLFIFCGFDIN